MLRSTLDCRLLRFFLLTSFLHCRWCSFTKIYENKLLFTQGWKLLTTTSTSSNSYVHWLNEDRSRFPQPISTALLPAPNFCPGPIRPVYCTSCWHEGERLLLQGFKSAASAKFCTLELKTFRRNKGEIWGRSAQDHPLLILLMFWRWLLFFLHLRLPFIAITSAIPASEITFHCHHFRYFFIFFNVPKQQQSCLSTLNYALPHNEMQNKMTANSHTMLVYMTVFF